MFGKIVPVNREVHKNTKVKPVTSFYFASELHVASVMVHEFSRAASTYPIVFIEDKATDEFMPVVLMGLNEGENLFVEEGKWQASYIPAIIRRYPFALAKTGDEGNYSVCLDSCSDLVSEEEGNALFTEDGEQTEVIDRVKGYLGELQQMEAVTQKFSQFIKENNLFTPLNMRVKTDNNMNNITGCYVINEERLNALSDEGFIDIRSKQFLAPIYAHLTSLAQVERLLHLKQKSAKEEFPEAETTAV